MDNETPSDDYKESPKEGSAIPELSVEDALDMFEVYKNHWEDNYREARIDLKMSIGDRATQWGEGWADDAAKKLAAGKPMVVINELPQYIHQVTNDIRQNTPSIKVIPEADGDEETADIESGLIRSIEYKSGADEAYDTAAEYAVKCGIGYIRVDHDYCDDDIDEQELFIRVVPDPLSVYLDPESVDCDGRDANGQIILMPINKKAFNKLYPKKEFISFTDVKKGVQDESINLACIYIRKFEGKRNKTPVVYAYKFSGADMLGEPTTFPGDYMPYTPVYGDVVWIDGKRILGSLIRQARDPQRRVNHWASKESEILAMAPIAPVMAVEGTLVNNNGEWQRPGSSMVLTYKQTDVEGKPAPPPQRLAPPPIPSGLVNAMQGAKEDVKESMGIYNAGLGKREGDLSGIALQKLDQTGDVATFHFPDNVRRAITQVGRNIVSAIPKIYDTPRIIQIVTSETDVKMVGINGAPPQQGQKQSFDLTKGKYHVRVTTGASYTTKRQEASKLYGDIIKADPELLKVIGDLWAKNLDVAGAEALTARFKKMIPPQLLDDTQDPQVMALQQQLQKSQQIIQAGAQELQQLQQQLQSKQGEEQAKVMEQQNKGGELQLKSADLQLKGQVEQMRAQNEQVKLQIEQEKLEIEKMKVQLALFQAQEQSEPQEPQDVIRFDAQGNPL